MLDQVPRCAAAREQLRLPASAPIFALLPGSRQSELKYMADLFIQTAKTIHAGLPHALFLVPLATRETREMFETALYRNDAEDLPLTILFGHAQDAMSAADVVLVASGTATLEAALLGKPMVITYKMPRSELLAAARQRAICLITACRTSWPASSWSRKSSRTTPRRRT